MTTHSKKNKKNKKTISITDSALVLSPANTSFEEIPTPTATEIHTQPLSTEEMLKNSTDKGDDLILSSLPRPQYTLSL